MPEPFANCHMCHLHSHNHEDLVKTVPMRESRGKYRDRKREHSHARAPSVENDYYSTREMDHYIDRSRTNSLTRVPCVPLDPNPSSLHPVYRSNSLKRFQPEVSILPDGGDYMGIIRCNNNLQSLERNASRNSLFDPRTSSLPRFAPPLSFEHHIHAQPEVLVNAAPPTRSRSNSYSAVRRDSLMNQENSQSEYFLDMHTKRLKEEKKKYRFNLQTVLLIGCYSLLVIIAIVVGVFLCYQNGWLGFGSSKAEDLAAGSEDSNTHVQESRSPNFRNNLPQNNDNRNNFNSDLNNRPNNFLNSNTEIKHNVVNLRPLGNIRSNNNMVDTKTFPRLNSNNINNQNSFHTNSHSLGTPLNPVRNQFPSNNTEGTHESSSSNSNVNLSHNLNKNKDTAGAVPVLHAGILLNSNTNANTRWNTRTSDNNVNSFTKDKKATFKTGNVDSNTIAKTLFQGGSLNRPFTNTNNSNGHLLKNLQDSVNTADILNNLNNKNNLDLLKSNTNLSKNQLTTEELIDLLAIRRMRDLLRSNADDKEILHVLRNVGSSKDSKLELIREEAIIPVSSTPSSNNLNLSDGQRNAIIKTIQNLRKNRNQFTTTDKTKPFTDSSSGLIEKQKNAIIQAIRNLRNSQITLKPKQATTISPVNELINVRNFPSNPILGKKVVNGFNNQNTPFLITTHSPFFHQNVALPTPLHPTKTKGSKFNVNINKKSHVITPRPIPSFEQNVAAKTNNAEKTKFPDHDILKAVAISKLVNKTIEGAIINLINRKINSHDPDNFSVPGNQKGISVLPLPKKNLLALLEPNTKFGNKNLGPVTNDTIRTLNILNRLIGFNGRNENERKELVFLDAAPSIISESKRNSSPRLGEPVQDAFHNPVKKIFDNKFPVNSFSNNAQKSKVNLFSQNSDNFRSNIFAGSAQNSNLNSLPKKIQNNNHNSFAFGKNVPTGNTNSFLIPANPKNENNLVPFNHAASNFNWGSHLNPVPIPLPPDPRFSVMIKTRNLAQQVPKSTLSAPPFRGRSLKEELKLSPHPGKESVVIKPGVESSIPNNSVIRAWTHMDSGGTVSKGKIHSDGSFAFTNCRPVELCAGSSKASKDISV